MKKSSWIYIGVFAISMLLIYLGHTHFFDFDSPFSHFLTLSYVYLVSFTIMLCIALIFLKKSARFRHQLGFLYLFSVPVKIIFFIILFGEQFFDQSFNSNKELLNLLFIMCLTLLFEVFFVRKLLNNLFITKNVE